MKTTNKYGICYGAAEGVGISVLMESYGYGFTEWIK